MKNQRSKEEYKATGRRNMEEKSIGKREGVPGVTPRNSNQKVNRHPVKGHVRIGGGGKKQSLQKKQ